MGLIGTKWDKMSQNTIQTAQICSGKWSKIGLSGTVWKFQDFCITVILREINFEDSRSAKYAIFAIFGAVHFVHLVNFSLQKVQKFIITKIQSLLTSVKMANFALLESSKLISRKI